MEKYKIRRKKYKEATVFSNELYFDQLINKEINKIKRKKNSGLNFFQASLIGLKRYLKNNKNKLRVKTTSYK